MLRVPHKIVREVESLEMRKEPFVTYVNNLYVYPETLSLKVRLESAQLRGGQLTTNRCCVLQQGGPASANFQIEVRLKDTDTDVNSKGLPVQPSPHTLPECIPFHAH
jgi:hypothetical protein